MLPLLVLITTPLFGLLFVLNSLFHGFCIVIYNIFKTVHLLFGTIDSVLNFFGRLLYCNYLLVSRGHTVLHLILDSIRYYSLNICDILFKLCGSFLQFCFNLPALVYELIGQSFLLICCKSYTGISIALDKSIYFFSTLVYTAEKSMFQLFRLLESIYNGLADEILKNCNLVFEKICRFFSTTLLKITVSLECVYSCCCYVGNLFLISLHNLGSLIMEAVLNLMYFVQSFFALLYQFLTETIDVFGNVFEKLANFIIMPFSLENMAFVVNSIWLLFVKIITLPANAISYICAVFSQMTNIMWMEITEFWHGAVEVLAFLNTKIIWSVLLFILCLAMLFFLKGNGILKNTETFILRILTTLNIRRRTNDTIGEQTELTKGKQKIQEDSDESNSEDEAHLCVICQDQRKNTVLLPCKHLCLCFDCAESVYRGVRRNRLCPLCRHLIEERMYVYT